MVKSKGKWVVLSSSILASAVALNMATPVAYAQEVIPETDVVPVTEPVEILEIKREAAPVVTENSAIVVEDKETEELFEVDELVESIVNEAVGQDEALLEKNLKDAKDVELEIDTEVDTDVVLEAKISPEIDFEEPADLETEAAPMMMRMATTTTDINYRINYGDTLWSIANRHGVTVGQLKSWNHLTSDFIHTGNNLVVGRQNVTPAPINPVPAPKATHTVRSGEYLYLIASRYGVTVDQLVKWNNLSSNYLYSGNQLIVSNPTVTTPAEPEPVPEPTPAPQKTYTVKPGDSLWLIATNHGVTINQLKEWNNLSSNYIYSGNVFNVTNPIKTAPEPAPEPEPIPEPEPTPAPMPEVPVAKPTPTYTVKPGDSLWLIATNYGVTINQLKEWNNLSSNYIYTGNKFYLADPAKTVLTPKPETPVNGDKDKVTSDKDVKINGIKQRFYVGTDINTGKVVEAKTYFGQKFSVLSQVKDASGKTFYEVAQKGRVIGFVDSSAVVEVPVGKTVVYLDAGHGGADTGAFSYGTAEKELNLNISIQVAQRLRDQGYIVHESRIDDEEIRLHNRTHEPNSLMPDIYVSIHHNAMPASYGGKARGIMTLFHDTSVGEPGFPTMEHDNAQRIADSRRLAQLLNDGMVNETGTPYDMGIRPQNLHVTRTNYVPAALVELGFMDNWNELQNLKDSLYQQKLISGLVKGINQFFGK